MPVLLYNVPAVTGVNLTPDAVGRLAAHPNIIGVKETGSDTAQCAAFVEAAAAAHGFAVIAGSAPTFYPSLCVGATGGILAVSCVLPALCVRLHEHFRAGRHGEARDLQRRLTPLAKLVTTGLGVAGLKKAMDLAGFAGGEPRAPLVPLTAEATSQVRDAVALLNPWSQVIPKRRLHGCRHRSPGHGGAPGCADGAEMTPERLLLGPGPSPVSARVMRALAAPVLSHLDPEMVVILDDLRAPARRDVRRRARVRSASRSRAPAPRAWKPPSPTSRAPGARVLVVVTGYFGDRLAQIFERYGATVTRVDVEWGRACDPAAVERALAAAPADIVAVVHAETSTGVLNPVQEIAQLAAAARAR